MNWFLGDGFPIKLKYIYLYKQFSKKKKHRERFIKKKKVDNLKGL